MQILVISDMHANLAAFETVMEDAQGDWDYVWCLGDVVGYGPDPNECCNLLRSLPHLCLAGNHDWGAAGLLEMDTFNPDAAAACIWTEEQLTREDTEYLRNLPLSIAEDDFTLVHGSPREPLWEYIITAGIARENFARFHRGHKQSDPGYQLLQLFNLRFFFWLLVFLGQHCHRAAHSQG